MLSALPSPDASGWNAASELDLPSLRPCDWVCAFVEQVELAGTPFWVATERMDPIQPPVHRWCPDYPQALACTAEQANKHGLPLFDFAQAGTSE